MGEPNFTPGPWEAKLIDGFSHVHPAVGGDHFGDIATVWTPSKANARLIAAAPELYAAAEEALLFIQNNGLAHGKKLAAALAKARGEV